MQGSPNLVHVITDLRAGGTQRMLLARLASPSFRHHVVAFAKNTSGGPDLADEVERTGASLELLSWARPADAARAWLIGGWSRRAGRIARDARPDLVHSTLFHAHPFARAIARRAGCPQLASKEGIDRWMGRWQRWMEGRSLRGAEQVVAVSEAARAAAAALGVASERLRVVPNGIDPAAEPIWRPPAAQTSERLLAVGRLDERKGFRELIRALALARRARPNLSLDLLGEGPDEAALLTLAETEGVVSAVRIHAVERSPRRPEGARLATAGPAAGTDTLFVSPSREEGFGLAILEAMSFGLPILASRVGGVPELIRDGVDGRLYDPGDPARLAEAILGLLGAPETRRRFAMSARSRARQFPLAGHVQAFDQLYLELASRSRS